MKQYDSTRNAVLLVRTELRRHGPGGYRILMFALFCALLQGMISPAHAQSAQATYYAAPNGSGSVCSSSAPCSLTGVQSKVRTVNSNMSGEIRVYLRGGVYALTTPFTLASQDSGTNGYSIVYQAYPGEEPILSGGIPITGWSLFDSTKNIFQAYVGTSLQTRQLYVNGLRAVRARGPQNPAGFTKTSTGYTTTNTGMQNWGNTSNIEIVGFSAWRMYRCGVATISGTAITMKTPCWTNAQFNGSLSLDQPTWVENAYELLDAEGEWYVNTTTGYLFYKPRAGENLATASVIAGGTESMLVVQGTAATPAQNLTFSGLSFRYTGWTQPNQNDGYVPKQAGFYYVGAPGSRSLNKPKAAAVVRFAKNIVLERNRFSQLGGIGLDIDLGGQNNRIIGNVFEDISHGGIYLNFLSGGTDYHHPTDARFVVKDNLVSNNYVSRIGSEYQDTVGILAGFTDGTIIEHNELNDLPYSGISVGGTWGDEDVGGNAGYTTPTVAQNNKVRGNLVQFYMKTAFDGGGIYTIGAQANSEISGNYLHHQIKAYAALYHDGGTQFYTTTNNVIEQINGQDWLLIQGNCCGSAKNNVVQSNYTDTANDLIGCCGPNTITNNVTNKANWPAAAQAIIASAGIEAAYQNIKNGPNPGTLVFTGVADATVKQTNPTTNYGNVNVNFNNRYAYVRFNVTGTTGKTFTGSTLRLKESAFGGAGNTSFEIRKTTSAWNENTVTWNTRPSVGGTVFGSYTGGQLTEGQTVDIPLDPSFFSGDGTYEIALLPLAGGSADSEFTSREEGPGVQLLLTTAQATPFTAVADATVKQTNPTTNYGNVNVNFNNRYAYARFTVAGVNGKTVTNITLRLKESAFGGAGNTSFEIRKTTSAWNENTVTWNTRPSVGGTVFGSYTGGQLTEGQIVDIPLDPSFITGDGTYDIVLLPISGGSTDSEFTAREEGPGVQLIVTTQ